MRAKQIGFLVCRLIAVGIFLLYFPAALWAIAGLFEEHSVSGTMSKLLPVMVSLIVMTVAGGIWVGASRMGSWVVDDDPGEKATIDGARFAAVGLALLGVAALINGVNGLIPAITSAMSPEAAKRFVLIRLSGGGNDPLLQALLGAALLAFAPKLGLWLGGGAGDGEADGDERS